MSVSVYARSMPRLATLFLHHSYDGVESGPAEVVGGGTKSKQLRLRFIPFVYATPTFDDVVVARKDAEFEGNWAFEVPRRGGMDERELHAHGGRYAMIVTYTLGGVLRGPWFPGRADIVSATARRAEVGRPGRLYFAVPKGVTQESVMAALREGHPDFGFELVHPK
jgi:hypothetical protein